MLNSLQLGWKPLDQKMQLDVLTKKHAQWHQLYLDLIYSQFSRKMFHQSAAAIVVLHGHPCKISVNKFAVYFEYWSWRKVRNSPCGYWRVCCKLNELPHAQWRRICFNLRPYLMDSRSRNFAYLEYTLLLWLRELWAKKAHQFRDLNHFLFFLLSSFYFWWFRIFWFHVLTFLLIVYQRLYLLRVVFRFRIWFMCSKLISNAIAKVFWYHDQILIFCFT